MAKDDLRILINAVLDEELNKSSINKQLKRIQSNINKLKVDVILDDKITKTLNNFSEQFKRLQEIAKDTGKVITEVMTPSGTKIKQTTFGGSNKEFKESIVHTKEMKKALEETNASQVKGINLINQQIALRKQLVSLYTSGQNITKEQLINTAKLVNDADSTTIKQARLEVDRLRNIENIIKKKEQELQTEQKINNEINKRNAKRGTLIGSSDNLKDLSSATEQTVIEALKLGKVIKNQEIVSASLDKVTGRWTVGIKENGKQQRVLKGEIDRTNGSLYKQSEAIKDVSSRNLSFIDQMGIAIQRTIQWSLAVGGYYQIIHAIQDMTQQVIKLDTALTSLSRVTDMQGSELKDFLSDAIVLSDQLSNKLSDVLTIAEEFSRLGFSEGELLDITQTAQVLQNISDLDAKESVDALTSAMLNFNIAGKDSIRVADALNEVD